MNKTISTLGDFIAITSVSTDPTKKKSIGDAVIFIEGLLAPLGFEVQVIETDGHPCLCAFKNIGAKHTIGFYSHYDVQPAEKSEKWDSEPFRLTEKADALIGRGVADDKGHIIQTVAALEKALQGGTLNKNIILIYEGEEETGSLHLEQALKTVEDKLKLVDIFYILDSSFSNTGAPMIMYGLRGLICYKLTVQGPSRELHSGTMGNLAPNPANILSSFLGGLKNKDNRVVLEHFYDKVKEVSTKEAELLQEAKPSKQLDITSSGAPDLYLPSGVPYYLASKCYPAFDIHGIESGFMGPGIKNIIPATAAATFSFRLVPDQSPEEIDKIFTQYLENYFKNIPVTYTFERVDMCAPFVTSVDNEWVTYTSDIFEKHMGKKTIFNRSGGTIGAAEIIARLTHKPVIITGFVPSNSHIHGPNEHINKDTFKKGIDILTDIISQ